MGRTRRRHRATGPYGRRLAVVAPVLVVAGLVVGLTGPDARAIARPVALAGDAGQRAATSVDPAAYPWARARTPLDLPLDRYGFVVRECTSFAAWWLNTRGVPFGVLTVGPGGAGRFLNASTWESAARAAGWRVGDVPVVGAVAHWRAGEASRTTDAQGRPMRFRAGPPGHVAVVTAVRADGTAEWAEYGRDGTTGLAHGAGRAPRYLYIGVDPPAAAPADAL